MSSNLQVPELRLPAGDGGGGAGSGTGSKGTAPLLLVPPSNVPRRRHSWICSSTFEPLSNEFNHRSPACSKVYLLLKGKLRNMHVSTGTHDEE
ncbi:hypothetical protein M0804_006817 [Polistes exclamans]|nr:hypothetical protein M0804_006817 [Polistes exclamans]